MQARDTADTARDLYAVLGVEHSASARVITSAFRRQVRELRPDTRVDAVTAERFGQLRAAYETLRDPALRAAYDRERAPRTRGPGRRGPTAVRRTGYVVVLGVRVAVPPARPLWAGPVRWERTR